jgi:hypothetical protein
MPPFAQGALRMAGRAIGCVVDQTSDAAAAGRHGDARTRRRSIGRAVSSMGFCPAARMSKADFDWAGPRVRHCRLWQASVGSGRPVERTFADTRLRADLARSPRLGGWLLFAHSGRPRVVLRTPGLTRRKWGRRALSPAAALSSPCRRPAWRGRGPPSSAFRRPSPRW